MPDYTFYDTVSAAGSGTYYTYDEYQQAHYGVSREMERRWQEEEELREDKKKYPLFYWKEGIV